MNQNNSISTSNIYKIEINHVPNHLSSSNSNYFNFNTSRTKKFNQNSDITDFHSENKENNQNYSNISKN